MKHTIRRRRPRRPRPTRHQINQEINRALRLRRLFEVERAMELSRTQPDAAHLRFVQEQLAGLDEVVATLEAY